VFYLYSNLCSGLQKKHPFCNTVLFGRSKTFKVIQGRWFVYQPKRVWLLISRSLWLWSYLAPFSRYGDLLAKNCLFFLPVSHSAPSLPMFPLEFHTEVNHQETKSHGAILQWRPHDRSLSRFNTVPPEPAIYYTYTSCIQKLADSLCRRAMQDKSYNSCILLNLVEKCVTHRHL